MSNNPKSNERLVGRSALRRSRKGKLSGGIIAMSSAAILAIYGVGRASSNTPSDQFNTAAPVAVAPTSTPSAAVVAAATVAPAPGAVASAASGYKDGTYVGSGNSRHGGMQVQVVIQQGKITSANVISCFTRYTCSYVDQLVSEVLSKQSAPTNYVSGATDSSRAYRQAVTNALKQAGS